MKKRFAFTLVELIFVILILGIIGFIGSSVVVRMYENYITQRAVLRMELSIQNFFDQLSKYLENSIKESISVGSIINASNTGGIITSGVPIHSINSKESGNLLREVPDSKLKVPYFYWFPKDFVSLQGMWDENSKSLAPAYIPVANTSGTPYGHNYVDMNNSWRGGSKNIDIGNIAKLNNAYDMGTSVNTLIFCNNYDGNIPHLGLKVPTTTENSICDRILFFPNANLNGNHNERFENEEHGGSSVFSVCAFYTGRSNSKSSKFITDYIPREIGDIFYLASNIRAGLAWDKKDGRSRLIFVRLPNYGPEQYIRSSLVGYNFVAPILENVEEFQVWTESGGSIIRVNVCLYDKYMKKLNPKFKVCKESVILL